MGRKTKYQICSYSFNYKKHIKRMKSHIISTNRQTKQKQLKELLSKSDDEPEPIHTNRGAKLSSLIFLLREFGSFFYLKLDKHNMLARCRGPPFFYFDFSNKKMEEKSMFNDKSPYTIRFEETINGIRYFVSFIDGQNKFQELEVPYSVYREMYKTQKEIRNLTRSDERHVESSDLTEQKLNERMFQYQQSVDELILNLELKKAIAMAVSELPEVQRRRFLLYYERQHTYDQIAELEGCTKRAVKFSVDIAKEKVLKKIENI